MGHTVLMGRKTYESIIKRLGKPLPGRTNVVISSQSNYPVPAGVTVFHNINSALASLAGTEEKPTFVIGGAQVFAETMPLAETMYVTEVLQNYSGDVFFPIINPSEWDRLVEESYPEFKFVKYTRTNKLI